MMSDQLHNRLFRQVLEYRCRGEWRQFDTFSADAAVRAQRGGQLSAWKRSPVG